MSRWIPGRGRRRRRHSILIDGDRIAEVGRGLSAEGAAVVDGRGHIVIPGLVNAHIHAWQYQLRGIGADWVGFRDCFAVIHDNLATRYGARDVYLGNLLGALNLALVAGEVPVLFTSVAGLTPFIDSGKMRVPAVTSKQRYAPLPNVPTIAETMLPDFDVRAWYALAGPKKLPGQIVSKLNATVHNALNRRDFADKLDFLGAQPWPTSPREAQEFLASEVARWTKLIVDQKIQTVKPSSLDDQESGHHFGQARVGQGCLRGALGPADAVDLDHDATHSFSRLSPPSKGSGVLPRTDIF